VSDIETSGCQPIPLPDNMQYKVGTQHGLLVYQKAASDSTLTASMFALTSAGLKKDWSISLNEEQSQIVPLVYIKEQDIVLGRKAQIRLSNGAGTFVDTPSGPSFYGSCLFLGQTDVLCPRNSFEFFRFNKDFTVALAIRPNQDSSLMNLGGALRHATQNGYALTSSKDQILWHRLDLPQINFTNKNILVDAFQHENIVLDLNNHLTPLSGLQVKADETAIPHVFSQPFLKIKTGDASWQLDTSNDLALYNPTFSMNFSFSNDLWNMNLPYELSLHNINDAPRVKPTERVNDLDIGDTYMLDFFEVFEEIDRETLSFQVSALPAGFVREDTRIMATPTSPGPYSFSITATDPSGLSVSAAFSGVIKGKGSNDSADSSGGGAFGSWSVLFLCALVWIRRAVMKF
ncbi:MAG: hypothetical protein K2W88_19560, partial [Pararheinheimera sp.]|nr:hypothetical protein [Rheinheimera sp.]